jgi:hypothetical protein
MALLHVPFESIDERHLGALIDAKTAEARDIEYKRALYGGSDADISARCCRSGFSFGHTDLIEVVSASVNALIQGSPQRLDLSNLAHWLAHYF